MIDFNLPLPRVETFRSMMSVDEGVFYLWRANAAEDRAQIGIDWIAAQESRGVSMVPVVSETLDDVEVLLPGDETPSRFSLFDPGHFLDSLGGVCERGLWIDITGLNYGTWANLVREAYRGGVQTKVVYSEPKSYQPSVSPVDRLRFNLSERTRGPLPLPGFAKLALPDPVDSLLIPFLGFEGDRVQRVIESVSFGERRIFPILGVPGFALDYPFHAVDANYSTLSRSPIHRNVRLARANCAFEAFLAVSALKDEEGVDQVLLAPLGTKPHALGALLHAISDESGTTLLYDHPVRASGRSSGSARTCIYDLTSFLDMTARVGV